MTPLSSSPRSSPRWWPGRTARSPGRPGGGRRGPWPGRRRGGSGSRRTTCRRRRPRRDPPGLPGAGPRSSGRGGGRAGASRACVDRRVGAVPVAPVEADLGEAGPDVGGLGLGEVGQGGDLDQGGHRLVGLAGAVEAVGAAEGDPGAVGGSGPGSRLQEGVEGFERLGVLARPSRRARADSIVAGLPPAAGSCARRQRVPASSDRGSAGMGTSGACRPPGSVASRIPR